MINQEIFIDNLKNQMLDAPDDVNFNTVFRDLETWDSLTAMAVIVMINDEYGVKISDEKFAELKTIKDIYDLING